MDERITQLINQVKNHLLSTYGGKIKELVLYGSYAKGEHREDSDIDLLVIVDNSLKPAEVRKNLSDILFDILLEYGELISVIVLHEDFFKSYNYPFLMKERGN